MSKANPDGEGTECVREDCNSTMASNWYGKKGAKVCRACYGKLNQRRDSAAATTGSKRVSIESPIFEQPIVEPPLDAAAPIKKIVKIIGARLWDPSKALEPADLRVPLAEDEEELEYLIFGQFVRPDLKDSYGFLSTRWLTAEHLVEHIGLGLLQTAIKEWESGLAARRSAKLEELVEAAAAEREEVGEGRGAAAAAGSGGEEV